MSIFWVRGAVPLNALRIRNPPVEDLSSKPSTGEVLLDFKWVSPLDTSMRYSYTLWSKFDQHVAQRGCGIGIDLLNMPIHLQIHSPVENLG